jgi:hemerythrin-like metal-binding protein
MVLLVWDASYDLGIEHLDYEHRDLFECINALHASILERDDAEHVEDSLGRLHARLAAHFALEETTMRARGSAVYPVHKQAHDAFLDEVSDAVADYTADTSAREIEALAERVRDWIIEHITTLDRQILEPAG